MWEGICENLKLNLVKLRIYLRHLSQIFVKLSIMQAKESKKLKRTSNLAEGFIISYNDIKEYYDSIYNLDINSQFEPLFKSTSFRIFKQMAKNQSIGLSNSAFNRIIDMEFLSQTTWARLLDLSPRTLQRYINSKTDIQDRLRIEKVIEISSVMFRGSEVFGSQELFRDWSTAPNPALDKMRPIALLESNVGTSIIVKMLGRIEHGIFA